MYKAVSDRELNYLTSQLVSKIDNKLAVTDVVEEAAPHKIIKLDEEGKLPANILKGVIPIENIPQGALERCVIVENDEERFELRKEDVQIGDTVKVLETNKMFYVKDDELLYDEAGYEIYSSGSAEKLTTGRKISLIGDAEGSVEFDGTKNVDINVIIKELTGPIILGKDVCGEILPPDVPKGTLYLKKVPGSSISTKPVILSSNLYGDTLPPGILTENDMFFLEVGSE